MAHRIGLRVACMAFAMGMLSVVAIGCGDDSDDDGPSAGTGAGTGAGAGAGAGAGGAGAGGAGAGGAGGTAGRGTAGMAAPAPCGTPIGSTMCSMGKMLPGAPAPSPACCDMDSGNICGVVVDAMTMACEGLDQMGTDDPSCPTEMSVIASPLAGCCKPDGKCGVRSSAAALNGCVERTDLPMGFLMTGTPPLQAMNCGGMDDGGM